MLAAAIDGIVDRRTLHSVEVKLIIRFNIACIAAINDFLATNTERCPGDGHQAILSYRLFTVGASAEGPILNAAQCCLNVAHLLRPAIETKNGHVPHRGLPGLIHFIGIPLDGKNLPVFAQIVKRDCPLGLERALELCQLNCFHDIALFGVQLGYICCTDIVCSIWLAVALLFWGTGLPSDLIETRAEAAFPLTRKLPRFGTAMAVRLSPITPAPPGMTATVPPPFVED